MTNADFNPKISVIMPVYNMEKFLAKAIDSILNQTINNFEFIIINDGSTDNSLNILKSYNDKRIKIINNSKNLGIAKSLNKGKEVAVGEYIARQDADDISEPDRFFHQLDYLNKNKWIIQTFGRDSGPAKNYLNPKFKTISLNSILS